MSNEPIENDDMPSEVDFSKSARGLHHIPPDTKVFLPASIERSVWQYFSKKIKINGSAEVRRGFETDVAPSKLLT
jgi:hypothetical protein